MLHSARLKMCRFIVKVESDLALAGGWWWWWSQGRIIDEVIQFGVSDTTKEIASSGSPNTIKRIRQLNSTTENIFLA